MARTMDLIWESRSEIFFAISKSPGRRFEGPSKSRHTCNSHRSIRAISFSRESKAVARQRPGTPVFLIAPRRRELASWHNVELKEGVRGRFRNGASPGLNGGKIDDAIGDGPPDLHWQVDAEDSVFAKTAAIPARASAPTARQHIATDADAKSSSTRIERLGVEARDAVECNCRRILPYAVGADACCPARWHVPLGRTIRQGRDGGSAR